MLTRYKIGDVARILGVTPQALRFFEKEGVVMPHKSEMGTRYYSIDQLVQLLSYKKYRQAEFSVQDIVNHFNSGSITELEQKLGERQSELEEQSRVLALRAQAVEFQRLLIRIAAKTPEIVLVERPATRVLDVPLSEIAKATRGEMEDFAAFENTMPAALVSFTRPHRRGVPPCYRLAIREEDAIRWKLPQRNTFLLPAKRCVAASLRFDIQDDENPLDELDGRLRDAGYLPDESKEIFGVHVASETKNGKVCLYSLILTELEAD